MLRFLFLLALLLPVQALALGPYSNAVLDEAGNGIAAVNVTVYLADTVTLASLYSDNGTTPIANPLTTDYAGRFEFWAANGLYDVCYSKTGIEPWCDENEKIIDAGHVGAAVFNVTDPRFGAIAGDGLDDSAAFQAGLDAIEDSGEPGVLVVPSGGEFDIYSVVNLPSNVTITGGGKLVNHITEKHNLTGFMFRAECHENITIAELEIDGNSALTGYEGSAYPGVLYFAGCSNVVVRDCHIYDVSGDGVLISEYDGGGDPCDYSSNISITGNLIERCHRDGIVLDSAKGVVIANNRIIDHWGVGIDIEPYFSLTPRTVEGVTITGNYVYTSQDGAWTGWEPLVQSRSLDVTCTNWDDGIFISGVSVVGNHFETYTATPNPASTLYVSDVFIAYASTADASPDSVFGGQLVFSGNVVKTNRVSTATGSYGLVTIRTNATVSVVGNTIEGPWAVNSGGNYGALSGLSMTGDAGTLWNPVVSDNTIRGYFQMGVSMADFRDAVLTGNSIFMDQPDTGTAAATYGMRFTNYQGLTVTGGSIRVAGYPLYFGGTVLGEASSTFTGVSLRSRRLAYAMRFESDAHIDGLHFTGCTVNAAVGPAGGDNIIARLVMTGASVVGYSDRETQFTSDAQVTTGSRQFAIDVRDYGANGNDSNSDTAAIQAAIDAAELHGSCYINFPSGVFRVDSLKVEGDGIILRGAGTGTTADSDEGTLIRPHSSLASSYLLTIGADARTTYRSGAVGIKFHYGGGYACQSLVRMVNSRSGVISDCVFYLNASYADANSCLVIDTSGGNDSSGNVIDNCYFQSTRYITGGGGGYGYGVQIVNAGYGDGSYNTANMFSNCKFLSGSMTSSSGGIILTSGGDVGANSFVNCHIGLQSTGTPAGVKLGGLRGGEMMTNCTIDGEAGETVLEFGNLGTGAAACYFQGSIDGVWVDANDVDDEKATVIDNADDSQINVRALRLIPRSAAPTSPSEGDLYYDSDTNKLMIYVDDGSPAWETVTHAP